MSLSNNLLYARIFYRLRDKPYYQLGAAENEQLDTPVINRIVRHFASQRGASTVNDIYSQLEEDHEFS